MIIQCEAGNVIVEGKILARGGKGGDAKLGGDSSTGRGGGGGGGSIFLSASIHLLLGRSARLDARGGLSGWHHYEKDCRGASGLISLMDSDGKIEFAPGVVDPKPALGKK